MTHALPLWTAKDAVNITEGDVRGNWSADGVSIDTRTLEKGDLFVAISGPNYDGHSFISTAFKAGAAAAVVSNTSPDTLGNNPGLLVPDTLQALGLLAATARQRTKAKITAITGSVGKTSTKEALAHVLSQQGETCATKSSLNNHWGVPLSLARTPESTKFGIFEIGMNHPGEIIPLTTLVQPDVAIVTAVAPAHMQFFDTLEDIARAKSEIFRGLNNGIAVINRDTEHFELLYSIALTTGAAKVISFGSHVEADLRLIKYEITPNGSSVEAAWLGQTIRYTVGQPGIHWTSNSLAVLAATAALGGDLSAATSALDSLPPLPGRGMIHVLPWKGGTIRLIDDSYNANPASMKAALETLGKIQPEGGQRVAVLGDMLELGETSRSAHLGLIEHIKKYVIDTVLLAGPEVKPLAEILDSSCFAGHTNTAENLLPNVVKALNAGDVVLVKASNAMQMGKIVNALIALDAHSSVVEGNEERKA
ncbi:MAG: UDP-N-acetylmuramoyl-tripeptide--D-alanyl-D-alanine ligase [Pseudomonadota bacterium]|nr:UDP-N-acetylmuramoyl-tripeptide--D-alanyl-D-alanine ligase [Pseudomonadota bacterium]